MDEREFELINIIGDKLAVNQRDLSRHMNLSLGMVNMLIRRLISKGLIRINQLNKRKVEYILTPKGFSEKMQKSIKYTLKTINRIGLVSDRLREVLQGLVVSGERHFTILGMSDFALLVERALKDLLGDQCQVVFVEDLSPEASIPGTLLICREDYPLGNGQLKEKSCNLIEALAKDSKFVNGAFV